MANRVVARGFSSSKALASELGDPTWNSPAATRTASTLGAPAAAADQAAPADQQGQGNGRRHGGRRSRFDVDGDDGRASVGPSWRRGRRGHGRSLPMQARPNGEHGGRRQGAGGDEPRRFPAAGDGDRFGARQRLQPATYRRHRRGPFFRPPVWRSSCGTGRPSLCSGAIRSRFTDIRIGLFPMGEHRFSIGVRPS